MTESLSLPQARKLVLHSQKLPPAKQTGSALSATLSAIEHLGYVQIDTISVVQRAHHHTLWNRNPRYKNAHLDQLLDQRKVFEYWAHAASYLPMCDFRYSLVRKHELTTGKQKHWFSRDEKLMRSVLKRIENEGPLMAKDFDSKNEKSNGWGSKPSKQALENLFMQGELMVPRRVNFHKVYDLAERVLPIDIDNRLPSPEEYAQFLITRYLQVNGLGQVTDICYLLKNVKSQVMLTLNQMIEQHRVQVIIVDKQPYYALPESLAQLSKPLSLRKLKILSPFDNLLIQRKRMQRIFDYHYLIECYVPEQKRQHGYFCLPILWNGQLIARVDCKVDKKSGTLHIIHLVLEKPLNSLDKFMHALEKELAVFCKFNQCASFIVHKTTPTHVKPLFSHHQPDVASTK